MSEFSTLFLSLSDEERKSIQQEIGTSFDYDDMFPGVKLGQLSKNFTNDTILPEYVAVMIQNKKTKEQIITGILQFLASILFLPEYVAVMIQNRS